MKQHYALSIVTENSLRVLQRMSGILARNRLNVEQLTVFSQESQETSRFHMIIQSEPKRIEHVVKQLQRMIELLEIKVHAKQIGRKTLVEQKSFATMFDFNEEM